MPWLAILGGVIGLLILAYVAALLGAFDWMSIHIYDVPEGEEWHTYYRRAILNRRGIRPQTIVAILMLLGGLIGLAVIGGLILAGVGG